ncbi:MAG: heterodisulfide reductase subunit A, partial [Desulfovibrionales bacterium]|nr:heterodisulfide reductase subunit A [Desulfovibrionales bacterium]
MADMKVGVYICTGCDIGENVNMEKVTEYIDEESSPAVLKQVPFLCGKEGLAQVQKDIEAEGVNRVCVAACSPRVMWDVFNFGDDVVVDRANIRELAVWSYQDPELPEPEDDEMSDPLTMMVRDYIKMSIAKLERTNKPEAEPMDLNKTIMVLGG